MADLTIVGAGLIGCSFARSIRSTGVFEHIRAVEPSAHNASRALALNYIDEIVTDVVPGQPVLVACPADLSVNWLTRLADHDATVFDVGSVKGAIITRLQDQLGRVPGNYVPCHPIAGRELSGPDAAMENLFDGRPVIMTPTAESDAGRRGEVAGWWHAVGAHVLEMDPVEHDRIYATTSHLPHLLAFAYLQGIQETHLAHTGGGFRDFSRIGASDPDMWSAIFDLNAEAVLAALAGFQQHLEEFATAVRDGDVARCRRLIADAQAKRGGLHEG